MQTSKAYRLPPSKPAPALQYENLEFEFVPTLRRDQARQLLLASYRAAQGSWKWLTHLGFLGVPETSFRSKLPYYRSTLIDRTEGVKLGRDLEWVVAVQQRAAQHLAAAPAAPAPRKTRPRPRFWLSDGIIQHPVRTVIIADVGLVWLVFNFERLVS